MAGVALVYDAAYLRVTGETFWLPYWRRQLGPLEVATPIDGASTIASHLLFYLSRLAWHAAPWSLALVAIVLTQWKPVAASWATAAEPIKRGAIFARAVCRARRRDPAAVEPVRRAVRLFGDLCARDAWRDGRVATIGRR